MDKNEELNKELKEEVSKTFADLSKEIGNNRQQLANKVLSLHKEIHKELNTNKVDAKRKQEILNEVSRIVKMAAQQLPHLKMNAPKTVTSKPVTPKAVTLKPAPPKPKQTKPLVAKPAKTPTAKKKK